MYDIEILINTEVVTAYKNIDYVTARNIFLSESFKLDQYTQLYINGIKVSNAEGYRHFKYKSNNAFLFAKI